MTNPITEIHSDLIKIGLTEKEAKLYTAALGTSTFSLAEIAKASGLKRPTCYLIIDTLLKKSLIARVPDSRSARYIIVEPHIVLEREKEKLRDTEKMVKLMTQIRSREDKQELPHIELYHGIAGVKQVFLGILEDKPKVLLGILNPDYFKNYLGNEYLENWTKNRLKNGISRKTLQQANYDASYGYGTDHKKLREVRILPPTVKYEALLFIWGNKVAFISDKKEGVSFVVFSKEYAQMTTGIFSALWDISKEI